MSDPRPEHAANLPSGSAMRAGETNQRTASAGRGSLDQPGAGEKATSNNQNLDHESDHWDYEEPEYCLECGGDGIVEYLNAGPSVWGEDCPSEENHLVTCPNCKGSGMLKDCSWC